MSALLIASHRHDNIPEKGLGAYAPQRAIRFGEMREMELSTHHAYEPAASLSRARASMRQTPLKKYIGPGTEDVFCQLHSQLKGLDPRTPCFCCSHPSSSELNPRWCMRQANFDFVRISWFRDVSPYQYFGEKQTIFE